MSLQTGLDHEAVFAAIPGLYVLLGPDLKVLTATEAYLLATNKRLEDMIGKTLWEVFATGPDGSRGSGARNVRESQERVLATLVADTMPVQKYDIVRPDGSIEERHWIPMHVPVLDGAGGVRCIIHRIEDVSDFVLLKQTAAEASDEAADAVSKLKADIFSSGQDLLAANRKLLEMDRLKTDFFANVSHELRTPLTLILGPVARILATTDTRNPNRRGLETVERNARLLLKQVDELLDFAKIEAGKIELQYSKSDLAQAVRALASNFESIASEREIALELRIPDTLAAEVDEEKLERVILNLLSNAFKFTPPGSGIAVDVFEEGDSAIIRVSDGGPGIPPEARLKVFERFQQLEGAGKATGTGLGLAIVKEFVNLHGGDIHIEDSALGGAAFVIRLPLHARDGTPVAEHRVPPKGDAASTLVAELRGHLARAMPEERPVAPGGLVLIVDDNADMRDYLSGILGPRHRVETASNGVDGLAKTLELMPDLVISDVMMPVMTGEEMARQILEDPRIRDIPLLLLTAKTDESLKLSMLHEGVRDYIAKPFSAGEVSAKAAHLVADHRRKLADRALLFDNLERSNRDLERFAYATAHDLKSPLRSIHNLAAWIVEDSAGLLPEASIAHLDRLQQQVRRMEKLLKDVLDYSTISLTSDDGPAERIDGATLARHALDLIAVPKGFEVSVDPALAAVTVERMPLQQILANLIQNAIQHHDRESGVVAIGVEATAKGLAFSVTDDGPGIPPEFREVIFEMFRSLKPNLSDGGSGMGLALARKLAHSHAGSISVEPAAGRGSRFLVHWPMSEVSRSKGEVIRYA